MRRLLPLIPLLALLAATAGVGPAAAFTPRTRALVVQRATQLMPETLQVQLDRHARALYAGALASDEQEDAPPAGERLERSIEAAVASVDEQAPMSEVARRFGRIADAATDLAFALDQADDPRAAEVRSRFARYVEQKLPKIRVVFRGFADTHLAAGDVGGFADAVVARACRDVPGILRGYFPEGREPRPADFDDRSVPFAAASLEVSLAVTATARAWLFAWHAAHGDLAGAPGLDPAQPFGPGPTDRPENQEERER
jgi:hypothetical protein